MLNRLLRNRIMKNHIHKTGFKELHNYVGYAFLSAIAVMESTRFWRYVVFF